MCSYSRNPEVHTFFKTFRINWWRKKESSQQEYEYDNNNEKKHTHQ